MQKRSGSQNNTKTSKISNTEEIQSSQLMKLFEDELKDLYWAEKAVTKAIPRIISGCKRV